MRGNGCEVLHVVQEDKRQEQMRRLSQEDLQQVTAALVAWLAQQRIPVWEYRFTS